jgi:hypothetical protein
LSTRFAQKNLRRLEFLTDGLLCQCNRLMETEEDKDGEGGSCSYEEPTTCETQWSLPWVMRKEATPERNENNKQASLTKPRQALCRQDLVQSAGEAYTLGVKVCVRVSQILGCFCLICPSTLLFDFHILRKVPWTCARCKRIFLCITFLMDCCGLFYTIFWSGTRVPSFVFFCVLFFVSFIFFN